MQMAHHGPLTSAHSVTYGSKEVYVRNLSAEAWLNAVRSPTNFSCPAPRMLQERSVQMALHGPLTSAHAVTGQKKFTYEI